MRLKWTIQLALKAIAQRKTSCFAGSAVVFIIVIIVAIAQTVLDYAPLISLQRAEANSGQFDLSIHSAQDWAMTVNMTAIHSLAKQGSTGRVIWDGIDFFPKTCNENIKNRGYNLSEISWRKETMSLCRSLDHKIYSFELTLIDSKRESSMGFGREWPISGIPENGIVISKKIADLLDLEEGDELIMTMEFISENSPLINFAVRPDVSIKREQLLNIISGISFTIVASVFKVVGDSHGKFGENVVEFAIMEQRSFLNLLCISDDLNFLRATDLSEFSTSAFFNLPMEQRMEIYKGTNYDLIQKNLVEFSSDILVSLGYTQLVMSIL